MQKAVLSLILAFALAMSAVAAVDNIDILQASIPVSGSGGMVTGTFDVNNTGTNAYSVTFGVSVLSDGSGNTLFVNLPADIPNLNPGQQQASSFTVNLSTAITGVYNGTLTAIGGNAIDTALIQTTVLSNGLGVIRTSANALSNTSNPGTIINNRFQIKNERNSALPVNVVGSIFGSVFLNQTINLTAFSPSTFSYSVPVPNGQAAGTYTGNLTFTWDNNNLVVPIEVVVNPVSSLSAPSAVSVSAALGEISTASLTISNNGNNQATVNLTFNQSDFTDDDGDRMNITLSKASNILINPGSSEQIVLTISVPPKVDPKTYTGILRITGNNIDIPVTLSITVENILQITDIKLTSPGSERRVKPGEVFTVRVKYENTASNIDLEDMNVRVSFLDGTRFLKDDNGDVLDEDVDVNDLNAGDDDEITLTFRTPYDVDDGNTFDVFAEVTGKNKDDNSQSFNVTQTGDTVTVERERHEVEIFDARVDNGVLACDRQTTLEIGTRDIGRDDEDVELLIYNQALGISSSDTLRLSHNQDDNNFEIVRRFPIDAAGMPPGQYLLAITVKYDKGRELTQATVPVTVTPCSTQEYEQDGTESRNVPVFVQYGQQQQTPPSSPYFTAKKLGEQANWMLWVLILANIIIFLLVLVGYKKYQELK